MSRTLVAFFEEFNAAFNEARAGQSQKIECRIKAAEQTFLLRFATREMQDAVLPALSPLSRSQGDEGPYDFVLNIWDSASTGIHPPRPPWDWNEAAKGEIAGMNDARFAGHLNHGSGAISFFDSATRSAIFWIADLNTLNGAERAAPLLQIFQWCFQRAGCQIAHGAVVGIPAGSALIAG